MVGFLRTPPLRARGGGGSLELREIFSSILREFQIFLKKILRDFWSSLREFLRDFQIFLKPKRISNLSLRETFVFLLETNLKSFFGLREFQIFLKPKRISNLSFRETFVFLLEIRLWLSFTVFMSNQASKAVMVVW